MIFLEQVKIPRRDLPEFKITKELVEEVRSIAAITSLLAEEPELTKQIADAFIQASRVTPQDVMVAQIELREKVSTMVAEKLKDIPAERITKLFPYWCPHIIRYWFPEVIIPHIHLWKPWYYVRPER